MIVALILLACSLIGLAALVHLCRDLIDDHNSRVVRMAHLDAENEKLRREVGGLMRKLRNHDDGKIASRLASPVEAERAVREHTAFARLKDAEEGDGGAE